MLSAILIDDELHCLDTLSILLKEHCPGVKVIAQCCTAASGLVDVKKYDPDLLFLDIEMPGMNGFELLEQLAPISFAIIFTTSYDQYAIKAIRFSALDYLLKPIAADELQCAVKKVLERQERPVDEQIQMLLKQVQGNDHRFSKIAVPTTEGFELVPADEVIRCEADDNYTHLFLKRGMKIVACRTLKEVEEQLHDFSFFIRVHHSHVVNLNEVAKYVRGEGGYLVMSDGSSVNVSRSRKEALLRLF